MASILSTLFAELGTATFTSMSLVITTGTTSAFRTTTAITWVEFGDNQSHSKMEDNKIRANLGKQTKLCLKQCPKNQYLYHLQFRKCFMLYWKLIRSYFLFHSYVWGKVFLYTVNNISSKKNLRFVLSKYVFVFHNHMTIVVKTSNQYMC